MAMLALLLRLSIWVAAVNALFIWEACRVDGTCPSPKGKTVDVGVDLGVEAKRSQPLVLEIHRTNPVSNIADLCPCCFRD